MNNILVISKKELKMAFLVAGNSSIAGKDTEIILNNPSRTVYHVYKSVSSMEVGKQISIIRERINKIPESDFEFINPRMKKGFFDFLLLPK